MPARLHSWVLLPHVSHPVVPGCICRAPSSCLLASVCPLTSASVHSYHLLSFHHACVPEFICLLSRVSCALPFLRNGLPCQRESLSLCSVLKMCVTAPGSFSSFMFLVFQGWMPIPHLIPTCSALGSSRASGSFVPHPHGQGESSLQAEGPLRFLVQNSPRL